VIAPPLLLAALAFQDAPQSEPLWLLAERALAVRDQLDPTNVVLEHMGGVPVVRRAAGKLTCVQRALAQPWAPPAMARELRDLLARPVEERGADLDAIVPGVAGWLDLELAEGPGLAELDAQWERLAKDDLRGRPLLEALSEHLATAHAILDEALVPLDDGTGDARALLFERTPEFAEAWYRTHFPEGGSDEENRFVDRWAGEVMGRLPVDRGRQLAVARALLRLTGERFRRGLTARLRGVEPDGTLAEGFGGDVVAVVGASPEERVVLGGRGRTEYAGRAALVIDLGGDDVYARAAVVDTDDLLASVVLDLRGDDAYEGESAHARGGVAILCDAAGKDRYVSGRHAQGSAVLGFALLLDVAGNDTYALEDYGQGHATAGVGLLYDLAGDDSYEAWAFAQGGGIASGLAALVDGDGDDAYVADGHWPDVYGNSGPESFHGASQGYSTGHRPNVAGGLGVLLDLGRGEDRYRSGNFSQGGGYYFSLGLMYDGGGDDENAGYRYSQGFGVHQAVGVRWDAGGDDVYRCRSVAHAGMAWDEGVGWFLDDAGDDDYGVGGLGLGGAAQTGVAFFVDREGKDVYRAANASLGGTGGFDYHGKPSLAFFFDFGGGQDDYGEGRHVGERANERLVATESVGIFLDLREETVERALRSKLLRE
jgi:hypothetical protein